MQTHVQFTYKCRNPRRCITVRLGLNVFSGQEWSSAQTFVLYRHLVSICCHSRTPAWRIHVYAHPCVEAVLWSRECLERHVWINFLWHLSKFKKGDGVLIEGKWRILRRAKELTVVGREKRMWWTDHRMEKRWEDWKEKAKTLKRQDKVIEEMQREDKRPFYWDAAALFDIII